MASSFEHDLDDYFESGEASLDKHEKTKIIIQLFQRNARKTITTIAGLDADLDFPRILKNMKKIFACNGNIVNDDKYGKVIQLQGDHRDKVVEWIYKNNITTPEEGRIIVMGA